MESDFWKEMRTKIMEAEPMADLQRIENLCRNGNPDVNGCIRGRDFWVELKYLESWPVRESTVVMFPKYRKEQRIWFRRRGQDAGATNIFMFVQVDEPREYLLFGWNAAVYAVGLTTAGILRGQAILRAPYFPTQELVARLRQEG